MAGDLVTFSEAANLIGKNLRTIQRYVKEGKLRRQIRDGKNFVSVIELKKHFPVASKTRENSEAKVKSQAAQTEEPKPVSAGKETGFWIDEAQKYQQNWTAELERHAATKEELGIWKGRAEAYQSFAAKLLSDGRNDATEVATNVANKKRGYLGRIKLDNLAIYTIAIVLVIGLFVFIAFQLKAF